MSEQEEKNSQQPDEQEPGTENDQQDEEAYGDDQQDEEDETYKNNHDLIGVEGIIRAQKNEIEKKKVSVWICLKD